MSYVHPDTRKVDEERCCQAVKHIQVLAGHIIGSIERKYHQHARRKSFNSLAACGLFASQVPQSTKVSAVSSEFNQLRKETSICANRFKYGAPNPQC